MQQLLLRDVYFDNLVTVEVSHLATNLKLTTNRPPVRLAKPLFSRLGYGYAYG